MQSSRDSLGTTAAMSVWGGMGGGAPAKVPPAWGEKSSAVDDWATNLKVRHGVHGTNVHTPACTVWTADTSAHSTHHSTHYTVIWCTLCVVQHIAYRFFASCTSVASPDGSLDHAVQHARLAHHVVITCSIQATSFTLGMQRVYMAVQSR